MPDRLDRALLKALIADGRQSHVAIGEAIGLSATAVARRQRQLEAAGILTGYSATVDARTLDHGATAFVRIALVDQSEQHLAAFEAAVAASDAVASCHLLAGLNDYLLVLPVKNLDDFEALHRSLLSRLPHAARITTSFALRTVVQLRIPPRILG